MNTQYLNELLEKIEKAIKDLNSDTEHQFDSDYMSDDILANSDAITETIISCGLEWDGEEIPLVWLDSIWSPETFENEELYQALIKSEEYKTLSSACEALVEAASDAATSANIEAESDWNAYQETLDSLRYNI